MDSVKAEPATYFSQPIRQIVTMLIVVGLVGFGVWVIHVQVLGIFQTNPLLNGFIALVFGFGVLTCFWQVLILMQSVNWIEDFARHVPGHESIAPPRLLAPLAAVPCSQALRQPLYDEIHKLEQVYRERHGNTNSSVILTGHSLGGALALVKNLQHVGHDCNFLRAFIWRRR